MIEPELAFADLHDDMACATAYLQYVVGYFSLLFPFFCQGPLVFLISPYFYIFLILTAPFF